MSTEVRTQLRMPQELHTKLRAEAAAQDRSMNWIINDAIRKYTKEQKK